MASRKILIDTNICIDAIQKIKPFHINAQNILDFSERETIKGFVSAHSFDTIFYILIQVYPQKNVYQAIEGLRRTVNVASLTGEEIDKALKTHWPDLEDAIHYQTALSAGCDAFVTRNPRDFQKATLPIFSPKELLSEIS